MVHGTSSSVLSALVAVAIGVLVGGLVGLLCGFVGGWLDSTLGRLVDVLLAVPGFLLAVVIVSSLGFRTINAAIATGVSAVAVFARVMRSQVLTVTRAPFIEASALQGGSRLHILFRHVLPNAYRSVLALSVLQFGVAILVIAGWRSSATGTRRRRPTGGCSSPRARSTSSRPWLVTSPAVVIVVVVLAVNRISRWLRR